MVERMSWCTKSSHPWVLSTPLWTPKTQPSGNKPSDPTPRQATPPHLSASRSRVPCRRRLKTCMSIALRPERCAGCCCEAQPQRNAAAHALSARGDDTDQARRHQDSALSAAPTVLRCAAGVLRGEHLQPAGPSDRPGGRGRIRPAAWHYAGRRQHLRQPRAVPACGHGLRGGSQRDQVPQRPLRPPRRCRIKLPRLHWQGMCPFSPQTLASITCRYSPAGLPGQPSPAAVALCTETMSMLCAPQDAEPPCRHGLCSMARHTCFWDVLQVTQKMVMYGGCLDPHACFLLNRGMATLGLRMRQQCASALAIAEMLQQHPMVHLTYLCSNRLAIITYSQA